MENSIIFCLSPPPSPSLSPQSYYFRCWGRLKQGFLRPHDQTFEVEMTSLWTSKWPNFWRPKDQSFDAQMIKQVIYLLTPEQSLIYSIITANLPPTP